MERILKYMRATQPETSREANSKTTRNMIRKEARECGHFLKRVRDTAQKLGFHDTVKRINDDMSFLSRWMLKFGIKDEV